MSLTAMKKDKRIELRVTEEIRDKIVRAANYAGETISAFVISSAAPRIEEVLTAHEVMTLTSRDWKVMVDALDNADSPRPKLEAAAKRYKEARRSVNAR